jgi:hypothetical protein
VKLPLKCDVSLPGSKSGRHIASEIALLGGGWCGKRSWIENLAPGYGEARGPYGSDDSLQKLV